MVSQLVDRSGCWRHSKADCIILATEHNISAMNHLQELLRRYRNLFPGSVIRSSTFGRITEPHLIPLHLDATMYDAKDNIVNCRIRFPLAVNARGRPPCNHQHRTLRLRLVMGTTNPAKFPFSEQFRSLVDLLDAWSVDMNPSSGRYLRAR